MQGVLYVSHGSRAVKTKEEAESFLHRAHQGVNVPLYEICYLELANPTVAQGIERLVHQGVTDIAIVPVLLLSAGHFYEDIPEEIEKGRERYPHLRFTYGEPIGVQKRITQVLIDRIQEVRSVEEDVHYLLVGRGSRHPHTKQSIEQVAAWLQEALNDAPVDVCYLAACSPSFEEGINRALTYQKKVVVIPYLWFTGKLFQSMEQRIAELQRAQHDVNVAGYLGDHPIMIKALTDRVLEARTKGEWDAVSTQS